MAQEMTPEEIEAVFREYNEAVIRGVPIEQDLAERMRDANAGLRNYTQSLNQSLDRLKTSTLGAVRALKDGQTGASVYNNTVESGADTIAMFLKPLGAIGRVLGTLVSAGGKLVSEVNSQTDALFKSYQDLNRFGAGVTTGIEGVMALSQQLGYTVQTLGSFTSMLERSSQSLAMMGGTVAQGTEEFAQLVASVSDQRERWRRLGLDVDAQNEAYSGFMRIMTLSGRSQRMTGEDLRVSSQAYLENLVTLGKLTGQTVEELQTQREGLMSQQRFASTQRELERKAQAAEAAGDQAAASRYRNQIEQNFQLINSVPEELKTGVADLMTGFVGTSESALQVYRGLPGMARMIMGQNFEYSDVIAKGEVEASQRLDAFGKTLGGVGGFDQMFGPLVGFVKLESAAAKMAFTDRKAAAEVEKQRQDALQGATADQAKLREQQLLATQNIQSLIGVLRGPVTRGMQGLATATGDASTALTNIGNINQRGAAPGGGYSAAGGSAVPATSAAPPPSSAATPSPGATPVQPGSLGSGTFDNATPTAAPTKPGPTPAAAPATAPTAAPTKPGPTPAAAPATAPTAAPTATPTTTPTAVPTATKSSDTKRMIANEEFVPGRPLSQAQMSVIEFSLAQGNRYPKDVMEQYNKQKSAAQPAAVTPNNAAKNDVQTPGAPEYAQGGIATGPKSGYQATLHGIEAVVPLSGGRTIPVQMPDLTSGMQGQMQMLGQQMNKLDELINETRVNNTLTQKLLKAAQT